MTRFASYTWEGSVAFWGPLAAVIHETHERAKETGECFSLYREAYFAHPADESKGQWEQECLGRINEYGFTRCVDPAPAKGTRIDRDYA